MKMKKILLSTMFSLFLAISTFAQTSGYCGAEGAAGANLTWSISDGVLTISGTGGMRDYGLNEYAAPWLRINQSIKSIIISDGVTSIGEFAFIRCSSLTSVTISNSVTSIGYYAFGKCSNLMSVTIPNGVTSIGNFAFEGCSSLMSITIPNSVTSIGFSAFNGCSSLTTVTVNLEVPISIYSSFPFGIANNAT